MKRALILIWAATLCLAAAPALADTQPNAVIALHAEAHPQKGGDPCAWDGSACSDFVTEWPLSSPVDLYLIVAKGELTAGISALSCGVLYDATTGSGVDVYTWTFCASGLQFPNAGQYGDWPASEGGNRMTWDNTVDCQNTEYGTDGIHALAGSFYVYAYDSDAFFLTPNNNLQSGPEFQVGDCSNRITDLDEVFASVTFDMLDQGCNPCTGIGCDVPVQSTSWGKIKAQY